jgi:surface antigen
MPSLADYFEKNRYQPKFEFMARVTGMYGKIRWVGSVGNDTVISELNGPELHIHLDLPLKIDGTYTYVLVCKHKGVTRLTNFDDEIISKKRK